METKSFTNKLSLSKVTISNLNNKEMDKLKGGCVDTIPSCATRDCTWTCPDTIFCTRTYTCEC